MINTTHLTLTVSQLNRQAKKLLEGQLGVVHVEGEISNWVQAPSGHVYFSLKDENAQIRAACFKGVFKNCTEKLHNGLQVHVQGKVSLYEGRGDYQLIVESIQKAGLGALQQAFEALKQKLSKEGLFATEHKKPIPSFARTLGVITSPSGAALQDVLHAVERRFPAMRVIVYPTLVQGKEAAPQIAQMINTAATDAQADVLLLVRGGGSLEDLWPFNEEIVARSIFACPLPIISGVGHETDFTIADFVADLRAPTPTAAAELATPDQTAFLRALLRLENQCQQAMGRLIENQQHTLKLLRKSLVHPQERLISAMQKLDILNHQLFRTMHSKIDTLQIYTQKLATRFAQHPPRALLERHQEKLNPLTLQLQAQIAARLLKAQYGLEKQAALLHGLSPLAVLGRGFSLSRLSDGSLLRSTHQVTTGDRIVTQVGDGQVESQVI